MRAEMLAAVLVVMMVSPLPAQEVTLGDRVRVRADDAPWTEGRLMGVSDTALSIARGTERLHMRLAEVRGAERWKPTNPAATLLLSAAGGALGFWGSSALFGDEESGGADCFGGTCTFTEGGSKWVTGSGAGDAALGAGGGLVLGLAVWAIDQGDWVDWQLDAGG